MPRQDHDDLKGSKMRTPHGDKCDHYDFYSGKEKERWIDQTAYNIDTFHNNPLVKRKGDWIELASGKRFYPEDPREEDFAIEDIAHALSHNCRFGGHTKKFFSVAEHSRNVALFLQWKFNASYELALQGLLHDASEGYLVDIPRPIKPLLSNYKELEAATEECIFKKFATIPNVAQHSFIKKADIVALFREAYWLMPTKGMNYGYREQHKELVEQFRDFIETNPVECMSPEEAKHEFLMLFYSLTRSIERAKHYS